MTPTPSRAISSDSCQASAAPTNTNRTFISLLNSIARTISLRRLTCRSRGTSLFTNDWRASRSNEFPYELREAGLGIVYHGAESGDDEVLRFIDKGGTYADCIETARKLRDAEITHSVMHKNGRGTDR